MARKRSTRAEEEAASGSSRSSRLGAIQEYAASLDTEQLSTYYAQSKEQLRLLAQRSKGEVLPHRAKAAEAKAALVAHMAAHGLQWLTVGGDGGGFLRLVTACSAAPGTAANVAKAAAGLAAQPDVVARAVERAVAPRGGRGAAARAAEPLPLDPCHLAASAVVAGLLRTVPRLVPADDLPKRGAARAAAEAQCAVPMPAPLAGAVAAFLHHSDRASKLAAGIAKHRLFHRMAMAECEPRLTEAVAAEPDGKWTRRLHLDGNVTRQYKLLVAPPKPPRVSRLAFRELPDVVAAAVRRVAAAIPAARAHLEAAGKAAVQGNAAAASAALQALFQAAGDEVAEAAAEAAKAAMAGKLAAKLAEPRPARLSMRSSRLHHGRTGGALADDEEEEDADEEDAEEEEDGEEDGEEWAGA